MSDQSAEQAAAMAEVSKIKRDVEARETLQEMTKDPHVGGLARQMIGRLAQQDAAAQRRRPGSNLPAKSCRQKTSETEERLDMSAAGLRFAINEIRVEAKRAGRVPPSAIQCVRIIKELNVQFSSGTLSGPSLEHRINKIQNSAREAGDACPSVSECLRIIKARDA